MNASQPQPSGGFAWTQASWGAVLQCRPLAESADHFFTTADLRLDAQSPEWNLVAERAGVRPEKLRLLRQVHGRTIVVASASDEPWRPPEADGVITDDPSLALVVRVADCAPLLLSDRHRPIVAAVHAGWRSTMQRIAPEAVAALRRAFQVRPENLVAAIGPSLGACCGEMGEEVVEAFRAAGHGEEQIGRWFRRTPGRRPHFDLWRANADQLEEAGIRRDAIHVSGLCTRTHADVFHSYRAMGKLAGRLVGVIRSRG